ncbi:hypothetical protein B296_00001984 [Ensete ventricosum]|uniref:Uncharacterized protein n=1 Tax=Ensete ventricosum TaxID=4639 RepID=A0A427A546_ENSVE|nr:hypothetical protein B296_00001984 [Ensete ventricosum]
MPDMLPTAYCQGACRLVGLSRLACHVAVRPLSRALQAGRPVVLALSSHQPPIGKGATDWSTRCICSAMLSTPCRTIGHLLSGALRTRSGLRLPQLDLLGPQTTVNGVIAPSSTAPTQPFSCLDLHPQLPRREDNTVSKQRPPTLKAEGETCVSGPKQNGNPQLLICHLFRSPRGEHERREKGKVVVCTRIMSGRCRRVADDELVSNLQSLLPAAFLGS